MKRGKLLVAVGLLVLLLGVPALAQKGFFGFDPATYDGTPFDAETLRRMVQAAAAVTPPKNGSHYVFGFANLQRDIAFGILVENGILENAQRAGIEVVVADNRLSGPTALANAQAFVRRNVDFVIEFQTDVNFGPVIMQEFNRARIPVIAIDIPMPGAVFFGANNPRSGFMGGTYLAHAALAKWGDRVKQGYLVIGELPQSGAIPAMRTAGQEAGFLAVIKDFPRDRIIKIDTRNTLEYSYTQMANVLARIPRGVPIMVTAINDQSATGMLRAVQAAGREEDVLVVGMGADELDTLMGEEKFVASVGYFPERYGNYLIPTALAMLAGYDIPDAVLVNHVMVTPANVCQYYPDRQCDPSSGVNVTAAFPQAEYVAFLQALRQNPAYAGHESIIPTE